MRQQPRTIRLAQWGLAVAVSLSLVVSDQAVGQVSLGTAFTYQGELEQGGAPVTDTCEFEFLLFDAPLGGALIGAIPPAAVELVGGRFTVLFDFGSSIFTGDARFLEIAVCCSSPCAPSTILTPRQELTPTPHALALPGLYTQQNAISPNLLGGHQDNNVEPGAVGVTIGGGGQSGSVNRAFDDFGTIGGGDLNAVGFDDADPSLTPYATVVGGRGNTASGIRSTVVGGASNLASGPDATVAGGRDNQATGSFSVVAAGNLNLASGARSTIGGGNNNTASGQRTTVSGGSTNTASGSRATVPGGQRNTAAGDFSLAAGQQAQANHAGSFVWSDTTTVDPDFFVSTGPNQFLVMAAGGMGVGTNSPSEMLTVAGTIESTAGGIRFPDGTLQTTADTGDTNTDTLGELSCASGQVAKWDGAAWVCDDDIDTDTTYDGTDFTLSNQSCGAGNVVIGVDAAGTVICAADDVGDGASTLDEAYDGAGAGAGRTITADAGAVNIGGPHGLVVSGSVGIGTSTPSAQLEVVGNIKASGTITSNRIGIGTSTPDPSNDLHIVDDGQIVVRFDEYSNSVGTGPILDFRKASGSLATPLPVQNFQRLVSIRGRGYDGSSFRAGSSIQFVAVEDWTTSTHGSEIRLRTTPIGSTPINALTRMVIRENGDVGIGTTVPSAKLHVIGDTQLNGDVTISSNLTVDTNTLFVDSAAGTIGIGTTAPSHKLDVVGNTELNGDVTISSDLSVDTSTLIVDAGANRVGIGTLTPDEKLDVIGNIHTSGKIRIGDIPATPSPFLLDLNKSFNSKAIRITVSSGHSGNILFQKDSGVSGHRKMQISGTGSAIQFQGLNDDGTTARTPFIVYNGAVGIGGVTAVTVTETDNEPRLGFTVDGTAKYLFRVDSATDALIIRTPTGFTNRRVVIDSLGNLGIGTSAPSQKLHVSGSIAVTGTVDGIDVSAHAGNANAHHVKPTSLPPSGSAGGDLSGTYPNPAVLDDSHNHGDSTVSDSISINNGRLYAPAGAGNVLIGTGSPDSNRLAVQSTAGQETLRIRGAGTFNTLGSIRFQDNFFDVSIRNDFDGNLQINAGVDVDITTDLDVTGALSKGGGSFKIDHPLDPENKYLMHSFVESPDMMNVYNGNIVLDGKGEAVVEMAAWFDTLNHDFRYQLTAIGAPGPNLYIAEKIHDNRFTIAGGTPGMEVSWQVTGVRQDAWANANRIPVEVEKDASERGRYLYPEVAGAPSELGIHHRPGVVDENARDGTGTVEPAPDNDE